MQAAACESLRSLKFCLSHTINPLRCGHSPYYEQINKDRTDSSTPDSQTCHPPGQYALLLM